MYGASGLPMIAESAWFSMISTKMWSNAGIAGMLAAYAAAGRDGARVSRSVDTNVHTLA